LPDDSLCRLTMRALDRGRIGVDDFLHRTELPDGAVVHPDSLVADLGQRLEIVTDGTTMISALAIISWMRLGRALCVEKACRRRSTTSSTNKISGSMAVAMEKCQSYDHAGGIIADRHVEIILPVRWKLANGIDFGS